MAKHSEDDFPEELLTPISVLHPLWPADSGDQKGYDEALLIPTREYSVEYARKLGILIRHFELNLVEDPKVFMEMLTILPEKFPGFRVKIIDKGGNKPKWHEVIEALLWWDVYVKTSTHPGLAEYTACETVAENKPWAEFLKKSRGERGPRTKTGLHKTATNHYGKAKIMLKRDPRFLKALASSDKLELAQYFASIAEYAFETLGFDHWARNAVYLEVTSQSDPLSLKKFYTQQYPNIDFGVI